MYKFLADQDGGFPITFYGVLFIAGMVSIGVVVTRAPERSENSVSQIHMQASAKPCAARTFANLFGKTGCQSKRNGIDGNSIVFVKTK